MKVRLRNSFLLIECNKNLGDNDPLVEGYSALDDTKTGGKKKKRAPDELDKVIEKLQIMVVSYGFPDPGNLRSKNTKEIKKTIKCFSEMLQQRERDIRFRQTVNEKFRKMELDLDLEVRKNQALIEKKAKLDREITKNKNIISSTNDKIKDDTSKAKIETVNMKKLIGDLKKKVEKMEKELKRKDRNLEKINEQMRAVIDKRIGLGRNSEE